MVRGGWHAAEDDESADDEGAWRVRIARALLIGGRTLPVLAVASAAYSRLTMTSWANAPNDDSGFTTAWPPNIASGLWFALGFALPFIALPIGSSALTTVDADTMTVHTVLGRRAVHLPSARIWRAWLPGKGVDTQVAYVRSALGRAILLASETWHPRDDLLLTGSVAEPRRTPKWLLYLRGILLLLCWAVTTIACVGLGSSWAGL